MARRGSGRVCCHELRCARHGCAAASIASRAAMVDGIRSISASMALAYGLSSSVWPLCRFRRIFSPTIQRPLHLWSRLAPVLRALGPRLCNGGGATGVGYGFGTRVPGGRGYTSATNQRSRAVMERLGMRRDPADDFDYPPMPEGRRSGRMSCTGSTRARFRHAPTSECIPHE